MYLFHHSCPRRLRQSPSARRTNAHVVQLVPLIVFGNQESLFEDYLKHYDVSLAMLQLKNDG